jgi:hypothetical protein
MKNKKNYSLKIILIIIILLSFIQTKKVFSDDKDLFSVKVKPNILFILDNSGSMSSGDVTVSDFQDFHTYTTSTGRIFTYPYYICTSWNNGVCVSARVRRYIALQRITIELLDKFRNDAYMGVSTFFRYKWREKKQNKWRYYSTSLGGQIRLSLKDLSTSDKCENTINPSKCTDDLNKMFSIVKAISPVGWTPLSESLDTIYGYYKGSVNSSDGNKFYDNSYNAGNSKPRVCSEVDINGKCTDSTSVSPLKWWCQKNFVILVTDGAPTSDNFNREKPNPKEKNPPNNLNNRKYFSYIETLKNAHWKWDNDNDNNNNDVKAVREGGYSHLLDDIAKYIYDEDMIPNDKAYFNLDSNYDSNFNKKQNIITYTVGFKTKQTLLNNTAKNGHGKYFTVDNFTQLRDNLMRAIFDIIQRNYAFTSFTAPKKIANGEDITFIGSFLPKYDSVWEGHLVAKKLTKKWCVYENGNLTNCTYDTKNSCLAANPGKQCKTKYILSNTPEWDVANNIPDAGNRNLKTLKESLSLIDFKDTNISDLKSLLGVSTNNEAKHIINFIRGVRGTNDPPYKFADIFHSDIQFVGPPLGWKRTIEKNYDTFYNKYKDRKRTLFVGTNDGIVHAINAENGKEFWGFVPDEVLPELKNIVNNNNHEETADGRMIADDIFKYNPSTNKNSWETLLVFGLRNGGNAYYGFDISDPTNIKFKWKIGKIYNGTQPSYNKYLGKSWAKPIIGKIKYKKDSSSDPVDKSVVIVPGGFADNPSNSGDLKGKAIMIFDAWDGDLLWILAYDSSTDEQTSEHMYSLNNDLNYAIPSAITAIDKDNNRYIDTIYFGNTGGNLFKIDISNPDPKYWSLKTLFQLNSTTKPIYLPPVVTYDNCFNLFVAFGTGDRNNPKKSDKGSFYIIMDDNSFSTLTPTDLIQLSWSGDNLPETSFNSGSDKGFYFEFTDEGEKLFDPEPVIVPDDDRIPHIFFNTYQPPKGTSQDPCKYGGEMIFYDITLSTCPVGKISGKKEKGRLAGGGFSQGKEYIMYEGKEQLGSTELKKIKNFKLPYTSGLVFWRERRR